MVAGDRTRVLRFTILPTRKPGVAAKKAVRVPTEARVVVDTFSKVAFGARVEMVRKLHWAEGVAEVVDGSVPHVELARVLAEKAVAHRVEVLDGRWRVYRNAVLFRVTDDVATEREVELRGLPAMGRSAATGKWKPWRGAAAKWPYRREIISGIAGCLVADAPIAEPHEAQAAPAQPVVPLGPHRARPEPDADAKAVGLATLVIQQGGEWSLATWRPATEKPSTWKARLRSYTDALGEGDVARLYAEGGACTWDSMDGAMKSKGERKAA